MDWLQQSISQPWTAVGAFAAGGLVIMFFAVRFLNKRFNELLEKVDSSVTSSELKEKLDPLMKKIDESVSPQMLELALYKQKERFDDQITSTRHSIRNELNVILLKIQGTLEHLQETVAEMRGAMKSGKDRE